MSDKPKVVITRRLPGVSLAKIGEKALALYPDHDGPMPRGMRSPLPGQLKPNPFCLRNSVGLNRPVREKGTRTTPTTGVRRPTDPLNS